MLHELSRWWGSTWWRREASSWSSLLGIVRGGWKAGGVGARAPATGVAATLRTRIASFVATQVDV